MRAPRGARTQTRRPSVTVVWPMLVVAALIGWGTLGGWCLRRIAHVEVRPLQESLPLGVALVLAIAGVAVAFDALSAAVAGAILAAGVAFALAELGRWSADASLP